MQGDRRRGFGGCGISSLGDSFLRFGLARCDISPCCANGAEANPFYLNPDTFLSAGKTEESLEHLENPLRLLPTPFSTLLRHGRRSTR